MHRIPHPAYHTMFASCCLSIARGWLCSLLLVVLLWVEPGDEFVFEVPVGYVYEDHAFFFSKNFAGKMTIPSKSLLSLLARCSLFCYAYATIPTTCFILPPILACQTSNLLVLANRCLAMLPLCSAPLIALQVAGEDWSLFLVGTCLLLGYHYYILSTLMHLYIW